MQATCNGDRGTSRDLLTSPSPEHLLGHQGQAGAVIWLAQMPWPPQQSTFMGCKLPVCRFSQTHWEIQWKLIGATQLSWRLGQRHLAVPRWVKLWELPTVLLEIKWEGLPLFRIVPTLNEAEYHCLLCPKVSQQLTSSSVSNYVD